MRMFWPIYEADGSVTYAQIIRTKRRGNRIVIKIRPKDKRMRPMSIERDMETYLLLRKCSSDNLL